MGTKNLKGYVMKEAIKTILKKSSFGKLVYPFVQAMYQLYSIPARRRRLRRIGVKVLSRVHAVLARNNIDYYLQFGTLLGVIREKDFIKYDDDIDLTIVDPSVEPRHVLKLLMDDGFRFIHALTVRGKVAEFAVSYMELSIDFYFPIPVERPQKIGICCAYFDPRVQYERHDQNNYRVWFFPDKIKTKIIQFKDIDVRIPQNAEWVLEYVYGEKWHNPIKNWKPTSIIDHFQTMDDFAIRVTNIKEILDKGDE